MTSKDERGVLFAGGGTGGHLLPSIAIAEELARADPSMAFAFAVSSRPIDREVLAGALGPPIDRAQIAPMPASPPGLKPVALAKFAASWGPSVRAARGLIRSMPRETVVVSLGGFVAPPVAQAARAEKRPIVVINIDAVPGKATVWIKRWASRALTVYEVRNREGWELITPIVRRGIVQADPREARASLGLDPETRTLLITGGSQGARSINDFVLAFLESRSASLDGWQVIHQTGTGRDEIAIAYERAGVRAVCRAYFESMGTCWGASDLALGRAGAGTVSEAWATRTPALFMPYPYHADDHQRLNAGPLVEAGAARVITDRIGAEANLATSGEALSELLTSEAALSSMRQACSSLPPVRGAEEASTAIMDILDTIE